MNANFPLKKGHELRMKSANEPSLYPQFLVRQSMIGLAVNEHGSEQQRTSIFGERFTRALQSRLRLGLQFRIPLRLIFRVVRVASG